jgi:hypothetical protein
VKDVMVYIPQTLSVVGELYRKKPKLYDPVLNTWDKIMTFLIDVCDHPYAIPATAAVVCFLLYQIRPIIKPLFQWYYARLHEEELREEQEELARKQKKQELKDKENKQNDDKKNGDNNNKNGKPDEKKKPKK